MSKTLRVFWMKEPGNCGDVLTPELLKGFGYEVEWASKDEADYICIGTIATWARPGVTVLGSGIGNRLDSVNPDAKYLAVRGPMTRHAVLRSGGECPKVFGDPALLMPHVYDQKVIKLGGPAFFAHYCDLEEAKATGLPVINPLGDPLGVIDNMRMFDTIYSSSLHGIILAHAYGIPACWVELTNNLFGDGTKFRDYAASVGIKLPHWKRVADAKPVLPGKLNLKPLLNVFQNL